ncbi:F-box/kelch-repeat protein At5g60570 [Amborella trichopoda]|uniref:F-box domain-containing protein n=1 Tax=Amborella trichopoda TaxID=13333 RepID=U5D3H2_AMBTC|nr:F-box/kelch-repeat protein At5g60570 [Amborella trichopoda]ERN15962.1 hypothetical protein AMTR_s00175p00042660 [Amborella trichopoda]|eukprot:XP_006854495.1 F-box/kelch-repeat protein At5g60570 [Amborella trichopoda]
MVKNEGCVLSPLSKRDRPSSHQRSWYVFTCMLELTKKTTNLIDPQNPELKSLYHHRYLIDDHGRISKRNHNFNDIAEKKHHGGCGDRDYDDGHESSSNDSLLPGLHDDIALNCLAFASRSDYTTLACLNKRFNSLIYSGYLYSLRRQMGILEHWVYLVCDLRGWEAFDPKRQRWMRLPRIPCDECFHYADKESLAVGTELLVFGRELLGFVIWRYSLLSQTWSRGPAMNLPRCLFGSSSYGELAIVAGGTDKNGAFLKSAELYNSESGRWEALPDMYSPRKLCSGFFMDGKFYVIGGLASHTESLTCGEEYNLQTRTWRRIEGMYPGSNSPTHAPPLVAVVDNQLYAVEYSTNVVKKYDKSNNSWSVLGRLPVRADSTNGWGLAFKACGKELLVVGGQRGAEGESIVLNSWSPSSSGVDGGLEWKVLGVKEHAGVFVYNCAVMGC